MKTTQQLLEEARKKREAAAALAAANPPPVSAKTDLPVVIASAEKPVVVVGERVEVDASVVKDGFATVAVEVVDGKSFIAGLALPAATGPTETEVTVALANELAGVRAQLIEANSNIDTLAVALDATTGIVAKSLTTMAVALGGGAPDTASMDPLAMVQLHTAKEKDFVAKFPVGGVAATGLDEDSQAKSSTLSAKDAALHQRHLAALNGVRA